MLLVLIGGTVSVSVFAKPGVTEINAPQQNKVTGIVEDETGPVIGASVSVKGTSAGTITNVDGEFTLNVSQGNILVISYIGYVTQEITYNGEATLRILLKEDAMMLDEVVVTAMGIKKEKRALSYAMSELKGEELTAIPTQNIGSSLYGKAAGVRIASTASGSMGGTKIQIRGLNSIAGNTRPLIVLDGVPIYDNDSNWDGRDRNQTQRGSALNDINPDDIESMSILKGANAAALYGSRASNGVILINTKKGTKGKGLGIEVGISYTADQIAYLPEYQNVFGQGTTPYFRNIKDGVPQLEFDNYRSFGPRMDGTPVMWWDGQVRPYSPQPDNFKDLFQNGFTNTNTISVSNGSEQANVRFSYSNYNYEGFLKNMEQQKHNFNLAGSVKLSDRVSLDANVSFNRIKTQNEPTRIDRVSNFPMPRSEPASLWKQHYKDANGYYLTNEISQISSSNRDNIINYLLWQQNENRYITDRDRMIGTLAANVKIIDPLNLRLTVGTDRIRDLKQDKEMFKKYSDPTDMSSKEGLYRKINDDYTKKYYEALLNFNKSLSEDFDLSLMAGASVEDTKQSKNAWESNGLKYNGMFSTTNNKQLPTIGTYNSTDTHYNKSEFMSSVYGSGQLAYKHYLYLDITARNDWSSRLPKNSRSYFYPSFGLGFVFTDAFKLPDWLTYGKVRASYAIVGNTTPDIYFANTVYTQDLYDNTVLTNSFSKEVPPVAINPEKTYSWEFGFDLRALNGRIGIDFAYFNNETRNQILAIDVPVSSGATKLRGNAGTVANHGIEVQLTGTPVQTRDFNWDATVNFSYTRNKLKSFIEGLDVYSMGSPWSAANFVAEPGHAAYTVMIKKWKRHENGELLVNDKGFYEQESDFTYAGEAMPKFLGGFSTTLQYKNFALTAHLDGQFGGKLLSFTNNFLKQSGTGKQSLFGRDEAYGGLPYYNYMDKDENGKDVRRTAQLESHNSPAPGNAIDGRVHHDGIKAQGVNAKGEKNEIIVSAYDYYNQRYQYSGSEDNLYDNTYIKFRELSLTYQLPSSVYSKLGLQGLNVSLIGSNLFYLYKRVPNVNPEGTLGTGGTNNFIEYTAYPSMRSYGISLKAKF